MNSTTVGNRTEAVLLSSLVQAGYTVSVPFGDGHRYDLIVDGDDGLQRVQCKTGRIRKDVLRFHCQDRTTAAGTNYRGHVDLFAVWCPENATAYLIPVEAMPIGVAHLRLAPARNGQRAGVHWAADYELRPGVAPGPPRTVATPPPPPAARGR